MADSRYVVILALFIAVILGYFAGRYSNDDGIEGMQDLPVFEDVMEFTVVEPAARREVTSRIPEGTGACAMSRAEASPAVADQYGAQTAEDTSAVKTRTLGERREALVDSTPQFKFFEGSMTRLLGEPQLALDAWELRVALQATLQVHLETGLPLPPEEEVHDQIRIRLGDEAYETIKNIFDSAPVTTEADFTRFLYRYQRTNEDNEVEHLVLRGLNDFAIWFLPRDVVREWGYLR